MVKVIPSSYCSFSCSIILGVLLLLSSFNTDVKAFHFGQHTTYKHDLRSPKIFTGGMFHVNVGRDRSPTTHVVEDDHESVLLIEIPGMDSEDVKIDLQDDVLIVTGKTILCDSDVKQEQSTNGEERKCLFQALEKEFETRFSLKQGTENIWAEVKLGILYIHIPKKTESFRIPIHFSDQKQRSRPVLQSTFQQSMDQLQQDSQDVKQQKVVQQEQTLHDFDIQSGLVA